MFEKFESPICMDTMPERVKATLDDIENCPTEEVIDFEHFSFGTPDGECDTDCWRITVSSLLGTVVFHDWIITGDKVLYNVISREKHVIQKLAYKIRKQTEVA